jgi:hypothetical protein
MSAKSISALPRLSPARNLAAIATLTAFFVLFSAQGSVLIYKGVKHAPRCNARIAEGRAAAFPLVMLVVHVVGYRLWKRQFSLNQAEGGLTVYRQPVKIALLQQVICSILAALTLDTGDTWHANGVALLAYWMSAGLIVARRLDAPTQGDLQFIRWAFLAMWLSAVIVGPMVWYRMEY